MPDINDKIAQSQATQRVQGEQQSENPAVSTVRFGPFSGMRRDKDPTFLEPHELWEAKGVINVGGRLRACWEGVAADTANGVKSVFAEFATETGNRNWPEKVFYWQSGGILVAANNYIAQFAYDGATSLVRDNDGTELEIWFAEFGPWLILCQDKRPAAIYHKDEQSTAAGWSSASVYDQYKNIGAPIWLYREWQETKETTDNIVAYDSTAPNANELHYFTRSTGAAATSQGPGLTGGAHGSGADRANVADILHYTTGFFFKNNGVSRFDMYPKGKALIFDYSNTNDDSYDSALPAHTEVDYNCEARIGYSSQQAMWRHPAVFQSRLCVVEGREYHYTRMNANTGNNAATTQFNYTASPAATNGQIDNVDLTDNIFVGDEIIFYMDASALHSAIKDYVLGDDKSQSFTVESVSFSTPHTLLTLSGTPTFASTSKCMFVVRRLLTDEQRRTVYFYGRPPDSANGIPADISDPTWIDIRNSVTVGEGEDGDITGLVPFSDSRLLVLMDSAIYEIVAPNGLPLDGVPPAGFDARLVTNSCGVAGSEAWTLDNTGQRLFFYSKTDQRLYQLYGNVVEPIDQAIRDHDALTDGSSMVGFTHLAWADGRLYCKTDEAQPHIFIFQPGFGWTYTDRKNSVDPNPSGSNTGDNPALDPSNSQYQIEFGSTTLFATGENTLYETPGSSWQGHGGIFSPYTNSPDEDERLLVCTQDEESAVTAAASPYRLRTLNYKNAETQEGNYHHGIQIRTGHQDLGVMVPKSCTEIRVVVTKGLSDEAGNAHTTLETMPIGFVEYKWVSPGSEPIYSLNFNSQIVKPEYTQEDSSGNLIYKVYRAVFSHKQPWLSPSIVISDGAFPVGEIAGIEADFELVHFRGRKWTNR